MNISLTPQLEALVQEKVASGMYNNASEVIREALRLLSDHDQVKTLKIQLLKKELSLAIESLDRKEYSDKSVKDIADDILVRYEKK